MLEGKLSLSGASGKIVITFFLAVVFVLAIFFLNLAVTPANQDKISENNQPTKTQALKVDLVKLESEYKARTIVSLNGYLDLVQEQKLNREALEKIKNELLSIKVPTQFKDLHIDLVMAMVKMDNFLQDGKNDDKKISEEIIAKVKKTYPWLN